MAQGFKPTKAATSKASGRKEKSGPKRGPRVIAPRKKQAVSEASKKKQQTASLTQRIEAEMAGRAAGGGPLTIMKELGQKVSEESRKEKERKIAKAKAKGRA